VVYRALLTEYRVKDEAVQARQPLRRERVRNSLEAILGFPVFVYGSAVNGLPCLTPRGLARRLVKKTTDYATARFLASVVAVRWMCRTVTSAQAIRRRGHRPAAGSDRS
jgi:hypothetical protein